MDKEIGTGRRIITNILSLFTLQGAGYLLAFIMVPYLFRVLGPSEYGVVSMAQFLMQFFILLQDHGFHLSATREVSLARDDREKLSGIFHGILAVKAGITILGFIVTLALIVIIPQFRQDALLYICSYGLVLASSFYPAWFFQGMERVRSINNIALGIRAVTALLVYVLIKAEEDALLYVVIQSLANIVIAAAGLWLAYARMNIRPVLPDLAVIRAQVLAARVLFAARLCVTVYTTLSPVLLGLLTNSTFVGYYTAADKIVKGLQSFWGPVNQGLYPHMVRMMALSESAGRRFLAGPVAIILLVGATEGGVLYVWAGPIILTLYGPASAASVPVLKILALYPLATAVSGIIGTQLLVPSQRVKAYFGIFLFACFVNLGLAWHLIPLRQEVGLAYAQIVTECLVAIAMVGYLGFFAAKGRAAASIPPVNARLANSAGDDTHCQR